jgi:hypothetical protein
MAVTITRTANPNGVSASSNVATYTAASIGTAAPNRIVVVMVGSELTSGTINSCTIDGNSMTAGTSATQGVVRSQLFYLAYPTGTTADIAVTYGANATNTQNHIAVYVVYGGVLGSTGSDISTDMDATDPLTTGSTVIAAGGGMLAVAIGATDTVAKAWANLTEDLDVDAGVLRFTTATSTTAGTATRTCTGTTTGEDGAMSWIIFTGDVSPTVALNSPADASTGSDTTPVLDFTGTDTESGDIRYNVNIDTLNTFNSTNSGNGVLLGYNFTGSVKTATSANASVTGDTIVGGAGMGTIDTTTLVGYASDPTMQCYPVDNSQTSLANAITNGCYFTFTLTPNAGVRYNLTTLTFNATRGGASTPRGYGVRSSIDSYAADLSGGDLSTQATTWSNISVDLSAGGFQNLTTAVTFRIYVYAPTSGNSVDFDDIAVNGSVGIPLLDKVSGTDLGFANPDVGGDTDPFTSLENIQYTVQGGDTLADDTYYWRVRGIDPSGSNAYGAWSSTRSFIVDTSGGGGTVVKDLIGMGFIPFAR